MSRFAKVLLAIVVALLAVGGGSFLWLTAREAVPDQTDYSLDVDELRRLADSLPGKRPSEVASALVADSSLPRGALYAGESLREPHPMVHQVFQVQWGSGDTLLIDTAFPPDTLEKMGGGTFHSPAWQQVLAAMGGAQQIVVTHEHFDHLGGVAAFEPAAPLAGRLRLTREQHANVAALDESRVPHALRRPEPLSYERVLAVAPGVVLVKAPGHTPGTQLVYVRTLDERELLFVGDVAWHTDQLAKLHYRPRIVTDFFLGEDRRAVLGQFRALHDLMRAHPQLLVVVSHDREQRERLIAQGLLRDGFRASAASAGTVLSN
jgi:glyoxylase-like metal-dependent hydrolase (beta-lactamase superfamily II)